MDYDRDGNGVLDPGEAGELIQGYIDHAPDFLDTLLSKQLEQTIRSNLEMAMGGLIGLLPPWFHPAMELSVTEAMPALKEASSTSIKEAFAALKEKGEAFNKELFDAMDVNGTGQIGGSRYSPTPTLYCVHTHCFLYGLLL